MIDARGDELTRRWSLRLLAGVLGGCVVLSGCSEKREANDSLPTASTSPTEEDLPPLGPEDLPMPDEARQQTGQGALEFARYFFEVNEHVATGTLDPAPLLALSQNCGICERIAHSYRGDAAAGYHYRGFEYTFEASSPGVLDGSQAEVGFLYSQTAYSVVDSRDASVPARAGVASGPLQSGMVLQWDDELSTWLVTDMTIG